jgi:hypothetical protein
MSLTAYPQWATVNASFLDEKKDAAGASKECRMTTDAVAPHCFASLSIDRFLSDNLCNQEVCTVSKGLQERTNFEKSLRCASFQIHFWFSFGTVYPGRQRTSCKAFEVSPYLFYP